MSHARNCHAGYRLESLQTWVSRHYSIICKGSDTMGVTIDVQSVLDGKTDCWTYYWRCLRMSLQLCSLHKAGLGRFMGCVRVAGMIH